MHTNLATVGPATICFDPLTKICWTPQNFVYPSDQQNCLSKVCWPPDQSVDPLANFFNPSPIFVESPTDMLNLWPNTKICWPPTKFLIPWPKFVDPSTKFFIPWPKSVYLVPKSVNRLDLSYIVPAIYFSCSTFFPFSFFPTFQQILLESEIYSPRLQFDQMSVVDPDTRLWAMLAWKSRNLLRRSISSQLELGRALQDIGYPLCLLFNISWFQIF